MDGGRQPSGQWHEESSEINADVHFLLERNRKEQKHEVNM